VKEELGNVGQRRNQRSSREPTHPRCARTGSHAVQADLAPDSQRFIAHCKWLLSQNCGLAVFGTNSEANSLSMEERAMLLDELVAAGVDPSR
jgi:Dihydrodipicolinate synthase/N-acetylneuraminate lyase